MTPTSIFLIIRNEFKVNFPDQSLETSCSSNVLRLLEDASKRMMIVSYKMHKDREQTELKSCMPYKGFVYTRMFWSKYSACQHLSNI